MRDSEDAISDSEYDDDHLHTKWAILVCSQKKSWIISRVKEGSEIGEPEADQSKRDEDWYIAAFFDKNVEEILAAMNLLGGGSLEVHSSITELLSGTCRSFLQSQDFLKELIAKSESASK